MDDAAGVGEGHGGAKLEEQLQPRALRQCARDAVRVQPLALDELHGEPGPAVLAAPAVQQAGDVRVAQVGQCLPFAAEQGLAFQAGAGRLHPLQRHLLAVLAVVALGQVDDRHAAPAQFAHHAEQADPIARPQRRRGVARGQQRGGHRALQGATGLEVVGRDRHRWLRVVWPV